MSETSPRVDRAPVPQALAVRDLFRLLRDLRLDCDVNPCAAAVGTMAPRFSRDPAAVTDFLRELGPSRALAEVLGVAEAEIAVTCAVHDTLLDGDPSRLAAVLSDYHNSRPLGLDEAVHIAFWPHADGGHVVFVKLNHMVVDLSDAVALMAQVRAHLRGLPARRVGSRYRDHAGMLAGYAALPAADIGLVEKSLGVPQPPGRPGIATIARCEELWLPLRPGVSFDELLSAVTAAALPVIGGGLVLQYPYSRWEFARRGGYFVEIRPLVVDAASAARYTPEYFERTRQWFERLGRFTMSDLTSFTSACSQNRMPRIVVSDTTFMRPEPGTWQWIPVRGARAFEDLKFLADRSSPPLLRMQYKSRFLTAQAAASILDALALRIGAGTPLDHPPLRRGSDGLETT